ncbi:hypothetical protein [Nitrobacter hamburgensis]|nr:hypothetical protein [Nitrobacter hamburgensis]
MFDGRRQRIIDLHQGFWLIGSTDGDADVFERSDPKLACARR